MPNKHDQNWLIYLLQIKLLILLLFYEKHWNARTGALAENNVWSIHLATFLHNVNKLVGLLKANHKPEQAVTKDEGMNLDWTFFSLLLLLHFIMSVLYLYLLKLSIFYRMLYLYTWANLESLFDAMDHVWSKGLDKRSELPSAAQVT